MKNCKALVLASLFLISGFDVQAFGFPTFSLPKLDTSKLKLNLSPEVAQKLNQVVPFLFFGGLYLASQKEVSRKMGGTFGFTNGELAALGGAGTVLKVIEYVPGLDKQKNKLYWGTFAFAGAYKAATSVWFRKAINAFCGLAGEERKPFDVDQLKTDCEDQTTYQKSKDLEEIKRIDATTQSNMSKALLAGALYSVIRGPWFEFGKWFRF